MTTDDIRCMPAGREMDGLIARFFFGLVRQWEDCWSPCSDSGVIADVCLPLEHYSTDMNAAMSVFERLAKEHRAELRWSMNPDCWHLGQSVPGLCRHDPAGYLPRGIAADGSTREEKRATGDVMDDHMPPLPPAAEYIAAATEYVWAHAKLDDAREKMTTAWAAVPEDDRRFLVPPAQLPITPSRTTEERIDKFTLELIELNVPLKVINAMLNEGIHSLDELTAMTEESLGLVRNIGTASIAAIKTALATKGLRLRDGE